ncbi:diguanylate cyclase [Colwellia sp. Arc7-635]|jgi:diguanylate cyclase (GGDEF)-like protein|uniref:sensor domain-containing diguanylate cyclase n=1 Tax=Colwellia sp. Arc7-635 TaxID=2497879 RepID=UPI000F859D59|nr:sensor domain-containing diguanylate cyclase [Colwellia sp. Arc7-635]AZQ84535.1 diguanylate cyclase [Colwellia sp. Arc7-635]
MDDSYKFLSLVLDAITENIVVIDDAGEIQFVNKTWSEFGDNNACMIGDSWKGVNYIDECDKAAAMGDEFGAQASEGIKSVIAHEQENFYFEYPCHSPDEKRWFMMRVTPFQSENSHYFVISHQNITERKLAEEQVSKLARIDGLTDIANRRTFDDFLHQEWKRCSRLNKPICLAIVDLDHFKLLNDTYGHQCGDECLVKIGELLKEFANRPSDICARYGGEEFALVWGDTSIAQAKKISDQLLKKIANLNIMNSESPTERYLTASIGLAEVVPARGSEESGLVSKADSELYKAKECGRNRVES